MTGELHGDRRENRQMMTRFLAMIARQDPQRQLEDITTDFSHARATDPTYNGVPQSPYRRVATRLQREFILRAAATGEDILTQVAIDPSVAEGCTVIAKALRYAPLGYLAYKANQQQDMEEFGTALRASVDAVRGFAETDRDRARIYETALNVYPLGDAVPHEPQPFVFAETPQGLHYMPSPVSLDHANARIAALEASGELPQTPKHRKCAALGAVMEGLWDRAVTICMEGPSLFPNDFSPEPVVYPTNFPNDMPR